MDNNQNNMVQNDYYNNDSYYSNNNYSDNYNNASYTQEKKSNGLWWKLLLLIVLIVIIILLLLKFCGSGSGKSADEKYAEFSKRICDAAKTHISNNPTLMGTAEPGKSVVIKLKTLSDANLIEAQLQNPYYDGNLFKKGTQEKYYSLNNSVRVMVAGDGSYYCELVDNSKDVTPPELRLNGDEEITMTVGTDFEDPGYTATDDFDGDITDKVVRSGSVDNSKAGTYTLTYTVQDSAGNATSKTRTIIFTEYSGSSITLGSILDGVTPMIKLRGANPYCMVKGTQYVEPGAMATDNVDGNITDRIVVTNKVTGNIMGTFRLVYTVEDSSGNKAIAYRAVIVSTECPEQSSSDNSGSTGVVNNAPVITLVGKNSVTIAKGSEYIDLGATAYDKEDGDLTSQITTDDTQVNVNAAGIYKVIYRVTDSGGKTATKSRIVTVKDTSVVGNPQVRFTENKENITVRVTEGSNSLLTPPKAVNENGVQVAVTQKIEDYTTKQAVSAIDWSKVGKYRVLYTAVHGNGTLKQTKTIVVTIIDGETTIGGKDVIEVALRKNNCDITEADLIKGGVTFNASDGLTPIVTLSGHIGKACVLGTYKVKVVATAGEGISAVKDVTVKVVDKGGQEISTDFPSNIVVTSHSANASNPYNTNGLWAGGAVTGIKITFKDTIAKGNEIARFEYSTSCNTVDGNTEILINRETLEATGSLTWTTEGQNSICIRAVSTEGIPGPWSNPVKLYLDKTGPKAVFTHTWKDGVSDWHNQESLTITYNATDEGSGLDHFEYTYDDVKAKKAENITTYWESDGSLTVKENTEPNRTQLYIYVRAVDKVGNKGEWTLKPAYANMDTVKPGAPVIDKVTGNNTTLVELTARAKDNNSVRPSGIGKFVYTLNNGDELSVSAKALRGILCDPLTQTCPTGNAFVTECTNSTPAGVAGKDYTQVEDACERASDYNGTITMPTNTSGSNVNYDVRVWSVDRAGNRSDGYASQSVTVTPTKNPVTAVDIYNGNDKIADKASCSNKTVSVGDTVTLKAITTPENADNANYEWSVEGDLKYLMLTSKCVELYGSSTSLTKCNEIGISIKSEGTATVTVKAGEKTSSCTLTVKGDLIQCPAGQYLPKGKDKCEDCLAGSYCEGGSYLINDSTDQGINKCPAGTYSVAKATKCVNCPEHTYNDKEGAASCTHCPDGTASPAGSTSKTQCTTVSSSPSQSQAKYCYKCSDKGEWNRVADYGTAADCKAKCSGGSCYASASQKKPSTCTDTTGGGKCYCCGGSQGCRYTWADENPNTYSCGVVNKSKSACTGTTYDEAVANCKKLHNNQSDWYYNSCPTGQEMISRDASNCVHCTTVTTSCPDNYKLVNGKCEYCKMTNVKTFVKNKCEASECNPGYWGSQCARCANYTPGATYSTKCNISGCGAGYKLNLTGTCVSRSVDHATSYSSGCTPKTCEAGYEVSGSKCVKKTCEKGQYLDGSTCKTCSNNKNVESWSTSGTCTISKCLPGYRNNGNSCVVCNSANVATYLSGCTPKTCVAGFKLNLAGTSCVSCNVSHATSYSTGCTPKTCEAGYEVSGSTCVKKAATAIGTCTCTKVVTVPASGSCKCKVGSGSAARIVSGSCSGSTCKCNGNGTVSSTTCKGAYSYTDMKDGTCVLKGIFNTPSCSCPSGYTAQGTGTCKKA